jgi:multicomponent K+:H+ antiporter subunit D
MSDRARTGETVLDPGEAPIPAYATFGNVEDPGEPRDPGEEVGVAIPAATAFLGLMFVCCTLLIAGLPPLSGFVAKFALLVAALDARPVLKMPGQSWLLVCALLMSTMASLVACARVGMRLFWSPAGRTTPRLRVLEATPAAFLVVLCIALTAYAAPVMSYLEKAAVGLHSPRPYIDAVLSSHRERPAAQETGR